MPRLSELLERLDPITADFTFIRKFNQRNISIFAFANNHYAGHAPATVRLFWQLWRKKAEPARTIEESAGPGRFTSHWTRQVASTTADLGHHALANRDGHLALR